MSLLGLRREYLIQKLIFSLRYVNQQATSKLGTTNTTAPKGYYLVMPAISDIEIVYNK
jgi:hypothetical protein